MSLAEGPNVQRRVADLFERFYSSYCSENALFKSEVDGWLSRAGVVLDAGCGSGRDANHNYRVEGRIVVGVDIGEGLKRNRSLTHPVRGRLEALPLRNGCVDLVLCRYVLEHLEEPSRVFVELSRVLREGGKVVLLTPNLWHYVTLISRITPVALHRSFNKAYGIDEVDTFRTFYRANTARQIARLARDAGLRVLKMELIETSPNYLEFSRLLYRLGVLYERVVNAYSFCTKIRVNIVATLEKSPG